jgi:putative glutamine amidotransferase
MNEGFTRPTVGITTSISDVVTGEWNEHAAFSPTTYLRAVQRAHARAVLLVADPHDARDPADVLDGIDAVILTGGASDVAPRCYGQERHPATAPEEEHRDAFEIALARGAVERGMPVLGICRGMQLLNVAYGGSLVQHLPDVVGHDDHRVLPDGFARHDVRLEPGSLAARAAGREREPVMSHHHQGLERVGEGLRATGRAVIDDTVEAIEDPSVPFALGVLWHPEEDEASRVIAALVDADRTRRRNA